MWPDVVVPGFSVSMTFPDTLRYLDRINIHNLLSTSLYFGGFVEVLIGHVDFLVTISSELAPGVKARFFLLK